MPAGFCLFTLPVSLAINLSTQSATVPRVPLKEVYQSALSKTQSVLIQKAVTAQTEERVNQSEGHFFPTIVASGTYTRQDTPTAPEGGAVSPFFRQDQTTVKIGLIQPIFHGFGEYAGLRQSKAVYQSQQQVENATRLTLYANVAQAYFSVLAAEKDIQDLKSLLDLTSQRVTELDKRAKIGRSRMGDYLQAQAQVATIEAQIRASATNLDQARNNFAYVTGMSRDTLLEDQGEVLPVSLPSLDLYLTLTDGRPDVQAQKLALKATEENITVVKSGHYPSLDLTGNYYPYRTGILADSHWDVGVALTVPIFQGGVINSQVREVEDLRQQRELQLEQTKRSARKEIQTYFENVINILAQRRALETAVDVSNKNYREQSHDFSFGLIPHLDVLTALNTLKENQRMLDRTRYDALINYAALQAAAAQLPPGT